MARRGKSPSREKQRKQLADKAGTKLKTDKIRNYTPSKAKWLMPRHMEEACALYMPHELYKFPEVVQRTVGCILYACGYPLEVLASYLQLAPNKVREFLGSGMETALEYANSRVANSLYAMAMFDPDSRARTTAAIFWLKCRAKWREDGTTPEKSKKTTWDWEKFTPEEVAKIEAIVKQASARDKKYAEQALQ